MVLYLTLAVCALLLLQLIIRYDLYDREPWWLLLLTAGAGAGVMMGLGLLEDQTLWLLGYRDGDHALISAVAATHEEFARLLLVGLLAWIAPRWFNDPMDGLIYGSVVGLGMAVNEAVFYLKLNGVADGLIPPSEIVRLFGHLVMGGITGFGVGMLRMRIAHWRRALVGCLVFSLVMHFLWDWNAFHDNAEGEAYGLRNAAAACIMAGGVLFYGALVLRGSDLSHEVFAPRSKRSIWDLPFSLLAPPPHRKPRQSA